MPTSAASTSDVGDGQAAHVVGLTGGIGSGKSTVAARFAELGAAVVDADLIAREVVERGQPALTALTERFGTQILHDDGTLDRTALAAIVFSDDAARADLNAITHPVIGARVRERIERLQHDPPACGLIVLDIPLLTETTALGPGHHALVVVEAPEDVRVERVLASRDMTEADVRARIRAQQRDEERRRLATHVIVNVGDIDALYAQVDAVFEQLRRDRGPSGPPAPPPAGS